MITTWVLILLLHGEIQVEIVPNMFSCIFKGQIAMQRDEILGVQCRPSMGFEV